jgi:hypothetical protein
LFNLEEKLSKQLPTQNHNYDFEMIQLYSTDKMKTFKRKFCLIFATYYHNTYEGQYDVSSACAHKLLLHNVVSKVSNVSTRSLVAKFRVNIFDGTEVFIYI